jgi:hypothetical protein
LRVPVFTFMIVAPYFRLLALDFDYGQYNPRNAEHHQDVPGRKSA